LLTKCVEVHAKCDRPNLNEGFGRGGKRVYIDFVMMDPGR
jgi:hypothetical protein